MRRTLLIIASTFLCLPAFANSPGQHKVTLKWIASPTAGVTYNIYRGPSAGVCNGSPTPYATGVSGTQFIDAAGLSDGQTLFYNVSAVGTGGAESACDGEVQVQIPVLPTPPSALSGQAQ